MYSCYGAIQSTAQDDSAVVDVTIPLQYQVNDSKLYLHENSKANLLGFYDPCVGEDKKLYIRYLFRDKLHEVTFDDTEKVVLPRACTCFFIFVSDVDITPSPSDRGDRAITLLWLCE